MLPSLRGSGSRNRNGRALKEPERPGDVKTLVPRRDPSPPRSAESSLPLPNGPETVVVPRFHALNNSGAGGTPNSIPGAYSRRRMRRGKFPAPRDQTSVISQLLTHRKDRKLLSGAVAAVSRACCAKPESKDCDFGGYCRHDRSCGTSFRHHRLRQRIPHLWRRPDEHCCATLFRPAEVGGQAPRCECGYRSNSP